MPVSDPLDIVRDLLGPQFQLIAGAWISGEIPVSEALVNRVIREQLGRPDSDAPITAARVEIHGADEMTAHVTLRASSFLPSLKVAIRIDQQPSFPDRPVLGVRWTLAGMGFLGRVAAPALTLFKALPPGVQLAGDRLLLDIRRVLESRGLGDVARCVSVLHLNTRPGSLVVRFELRVPESAIVAAAEGEETPADHAPGLETPNPDHA
jgi:hypothetical protein